MGGSHFNSISYIFVGTIYEKKTSFLVIKIRVEDF